MTSFMVPEHWPAPWQEADLIEYRSGFRTGRDGTRWIIATFSEPDSAAIWSVSNGDVCWYCHGQLAAMPGIQLPSATSGAGCATSCSLLIGICSSVRLACCRRFSAARPE